MDKIKALREHREAIKRESSAIRESISELTDGDSFLELSAFGFSEGDFFGEGAHGEGVVTGFATIGGYPFYIAAQNFGDHFGGLTKANCEKIARLISAAEKNETPVVYLLRSRGVRIGEGVDVLEGIAALLRKATRLKGVVPQYAIVLGEVYGSAAALASLCDCIFFAKNASLALASPLVLSAKAGKNLKPEEVGGFSALKNAVLPCAEVGSLADAAEKIVRVTELLGIPVEEAELNETVPALNGAFGAEELLGLIDGAVELGKNGSPEIATALGRIGGISVAAAIFNAVKLNAQNLHKLTDLAKFACRYGLPFVVFVDCLGVDDTLAANNSPLLREVTEYLEVLEEIDAAKIAVVTGKAIGLGYSLFAKSAGFDNVYALATSEISLFESESGAKIVYAGEPAAEDRTARYAEEYADPLNAAKNGYLDDVIEPAFVKQYLIASLQMLLR